MAQPFRSRIVSGLTPTSTGTVDVTSPGFGTPKAIIILVNWAIAADTQFPGGGYSWGVTDGTTQYAVGAALPNGTAGAFRATAHRNTECGYLPKVDTLNDAIAIQFDSWITDGVRLNFTNVFTFGVSYRVILLGGDDLSAEVVQASVSGGTGNTASVSTSFEPDVVLASFFVTTGAVYNWGAMSLGVAVNDGAGAFDQACISLASESGQNPSDVVEEKRSDCFITLTGGSGDYRLEAQSPTGSGFTIEQTTGGAMANAGFFGLALNLGSNVEAKIQTDDALPTGAASATQSWANHRSGLLYYLATRQTADNSTSTTPGDAASCVGLWAREEGTPESASTSIGERDNVATSLSRTTHSDDLLRIVDPNTSPSQVVVTVTDSGSSSHEITTNANAAGEHFCAVSISEFEHTATGTGDFALLTGTGSGDLEFRGDEDGDFVLPAAAANGDLEFRATGAPEFSLPTATGDADLEFRQDPRGFAPTFVLPIADSDVDQEFRATGTGTFPLLEAAGTGQDKVSATGAGTLPLTVVSATALQEFRATGATTLPLLSGTGSGDLQFAATGATTPLLPEATGDADLEFRSSATGAFPLAQGSASGAAQHIATADGTLPLPEGDGTALLEFRGTIPGLLPLATGAATGTVTAPAGTGAGTFPLPEAAASGSQEFRASGTTHFALPIVVALGNQEAVGQSTADFPLPLAQGVAEQQFRATSNSVLPFVDVEGSGTAFDGNTGVASGSLPLAFISASVLLEFRSIGSGLFSLPTAEGTNIALLGCDTFLDASSSVVIALSGSSSMVDDLQGSSNTLCSLQASSNRVLTLIGSVDTVVDLQGSHC